MTISALNRWRMVFLAEAALAAGLRCSRNQNAATVLRLTLTAGSALWLMHDLAHARWRAAVGDLVALAGSLTGRECAILAGVLWTAIKPERPPSPFVWSSRWSGAPRDTS